MSPIKPRPTGPFYAMLAYGAWGLFPLYWKQFGAIAGPTSPGITPAEILSHRMIWSLVLLVGLLVGLGRWEDFAKALAQGRIRGLLLLSATLLACNWGLYIYGVNSDRVVETSLGYFINPLVTVLLGAIYFRERFSRAQGLALGLAALGVGFFVLRLGQVPWIALGLAMSFAFYGLLRKVIAIAPLTGLAIETLLLTPVALIYVTQLQLRGAGHFGQSPKLTLLFIGCGLVTALPLLWFNNAAKRLRLSTLGLFQYLAPSLQLLLGVFGYGEPFTPVHGVTFGLIWLGLLIYGISAQRNPAGLKAGA
jgi:chloramphenicol-sensitive protein RarD